MPEIAVALSVVGVILLLWKTFCLILRAKRSHYLTSLDPTLDAKLLFNITNFVEFPFINNKAYEFALFRTFAIPSISKLLQSTQQFSPDSVTKRYDDTVILLEELSLNHVDSGRGSLAIRRLNFIHAQYNIANADLLYTLSLFMLEPIRFSAKYGYRKWTEGEKRAQFVVWHDIGKRMGINGIPQSLEEMDGFSRQYEAQHMVYSDSNKVIADATLDLMLSPAPAFLRPLARRVVFALLDERLADAMAYPRQPRWLRVSVENSLRLWTSTLVRWFLPPRPICWSTERIEREEAGEAEQYRDRVHKLRYQAYKPWTYRNGYRISELGNGRRVELGKASEGEDLVTRKWKAYQGQRWKHSLALIFSCGGSRWRIFS